MPHSGQIHYQRLRRALARRPGGRRVFAGHVWPGLLLAILLAISPAAAATDSTCRASWSLWELLTQHYLSNDGRIIDDQVATQHSTSESQSYGMFFALVAND
ncbi:MAG: glycosyl hydrolase family 8, partial [Pigmentiphaga sp.]